jgi:hypothetical protein
MNREEQRRRYDSPVGRLARQVETRKFAGSDSSMLENRLKPKSRLFPAALAILFITLACRITPGPHVTDVIPFPDPTGTYTPDYSGPCANVLYPFIVGRQWVYEKIRLDESGSTSQRPKFGITVVDITDSRAILNSLDMTTGVTTQASVDCQDGAITNVPMVLVGSIIGDYPVGDIQVDYVSGVFAPRSEELEASNWHMTWEGEYAVSGAITLTTDGVPATVTLNNSPMTLTWQNAGQETLTVTAGTFEGAYKVRGMIRVAALINYAGLTGNGTLTFEITQWFTPYVGLLKTETVSAKLTIFGITFPLGVSGSVDLTETH